MANKLGRNAKCKCGSGKKYKKCCLPGEEESRANKAIALRQAREKQMEEHKTTLRKERKRLPKYSKPLIPGKDYAVSEGGKVDIVEPLEDDEVIVATTVKPSKNVKGVDIEL